MQTHEHDVISIIDCVDNYHIVQCNGEPNGAFYYQPRSKMWQGITRANRLLTPTPDKDYCMQGVINAIGE